MRNNERLVVGNTSRPAISVGYSAILDRQIQRKEFSVTSFGLYGMRARWAVLLGLFAGAAMGCSSTSAPSSGPAILHMYTSSSPAGPWTIQTVPVSGVDVVSLVDPAPILMPDGRLLVYYTMNNQPLGDPGQGQPNNQWKIGVAQSTDNGVSFTHMGVVFTGSSSTIDPFPLIIDASGTIRLFMAGPFGSPNIFSITATDNTGFHFASTLDAGFRAMGHGDPEAIKIGSTYFLYSGGTYFTSSDGLNFGPFGGHPVLGTGGGFNAINGGNGTYLAAFECENLLVCTASSSDGITWTQTSQVGFGSVPGLVRTSDGIYRIYTPGP